MKNYATQAVVCLDNDLFVAASTHEVKPRAMGEDASVRIGGRLTLRSALYQLGSSHILPAEYRRPDSRLIIIAHGTPDSKQISVTGGGRWSPEQLANAVKCWLDNCVVKRIALKICYAGGSRGGVSRRTGEDLNAFLKRFTVNPRDSFAFKFARCCGFAETITAQTGESSTVHSAAFTDDSDESTLKTAHEKVDGVHKGHAYKIILTPVEGATVAAPKDPALSILNPTR